MLIVATRMADVVYLIITMKGAPVLDIRQPTNMKTRNGYKRK
jgi:hypothetical protein